MEPLRFRSRIDLWLVAIIVIPLLIALAATGTSARSGTSEIAMVVLTTAIGFGFFLWTFLDTSYSLTATELFIRCGPVRASVSLAKIRRVRHSRTMLAAPALSLRRLALEGANGALLAVISPADLDGFLAALKLRAPNIELP